MLSYLQEKELSHITSEILIHIKNKLSGEKNFETILPLLQDKNFINNNHHIFNLCNINIDKKKVKSFLTCFMLKYCPDEILNERKELEEKLIEESNKIFNFYFKFLENNEIENFKENILNYITLFEAWRSNDKKKLIVVLASSHHDLTLTSEFIKNQENNQEWLEEIEKEKKSIEKAIYKIGGEEAIEKLIDGTFWLELMSPEFKESIQKNLKLAFINKLKDELQLNKIPFSIIKCLKEIKDLLEKCVPSREDLHTEWSKKLHIELLNQELPKQQQKDIIKNCLNIYLNIIKMLESAERNEEKEVNDENLVEILMYCYEKIGFIFQDIQNLKSELEKKIS